MIIGFVKKIVIQYVKNVNSKKYSKPMVGEKISLFKELKGFQRISKFQKNSMKYVLIIFINNENNEHYKELLFELENLSKEFNLNIMVISSEALKVHIPQSICFIKSSFLFDKYIINSTPTIYLVNSKGYLIFEMSGSSLYFLKRNLKEYLM